MNKIYFAAPLHDESDRERNMKYVKLLRDAGHLVYVPQEHGVWEQVMSQFDNNATKTREHFFELDLKAMKEADCCVAVAGDIRHPRGPSEGMLWEMGFMTAANKNVFLFNDAGYWSYNLMPEFGSKVFTRFSDLLNFLKEESF